MNIVVRICCVLAIGSSTTVQADSVAGSAQCCDPAPAPPTPPPKKKPVTSRSPAAPVTAPSNPNAPAMRAQYESVARIWDQQAAGCPSNAACYRQHAEYYRCLARALGTGASTCSQPAICPACTITSTGTPNVSSSARKSRVDEIDEYEADEAAQDAADDSARAIQDRWRQRDDARSAKSDRLADQTQQEHLGKLCGSAPQGTACRSSPSVTSLPTTSGPPPAPADRWKKRRKAWNATWSSGPPTFVPDQTIAMCIASSCVGDISATVNDVIFDVVVNTSTATGITCDALPGKNVHDFVLRATNPTSVPMRVTVASAALRTDGTYDGGWASSNNIVRPLIVQPGGVQRFAFSSNCDDGSAVSGQFRVNVQRVKP